MRVLAVDIGNTMVDFGLFDEGRMVFYLTVSRGRLFDEDVLDSLPNFDCAVLLSVVPSVTDTFKERLGKLGDVVQFDPWRIEIPKTEYDLDQLGHDRFANIYALYFKYGRTGIVVDFGTAITIDVLKRGVHKGGVIMPGFKTSLDCLNEKAEKINIEDFVSPVSSVGKNTREAVSTGILLGTVGAVKHFIRLMRAEFKLGPTKVVLTGGGLSLIRRDWFEGAYKDPYLTLSGLYKYYEGEVKGG